MAAPARPAVVLADGDQADAADGDVLVNLSSRAPADIGAWARIAEVVDADGSRRSLGRDRYRVYRERGLEPATHEMGNEP